MHDACKNSTQPEANMVAAYNAWTNAGFDRSQLVIGLPSYGYVSQSNATRLRTRSNSSSTVTVVADGGQIQFCDLVSQGALVRTTPADPDSPCSFVAGGGFERSWDDCSSTPFLHSSSAGQVITYDDPKSLGMKAQFTRELNCLGINMFDVHGDTDQWDLTNSVRRGLGFS
jgi:chitinase